jgi:hypothetical protein
VLPGSPRVLKQLLSKAPVMVAVALLVIETDGQ